MSAININKENFKEERLNSEKTVPRDFSAPWCGPCGTAVPLADEPPQERSDIKVGKVNIDEQPELANHFGIMSIPTLMVMENGRIISQSQGARPKKAILAML